MSVSDVHQKLMSNHCDHKKMSSVSMDIDKFRW